MYFDFDQLDFTVNFDNKLTRINNELIDRSQIIGLGLTGNRMESEQFIALSTMVNIEEFISLKILDLSDNRINIDCLPQLIQWLSLPSKPYIKLTSTLLSQRNIKKLHGLMTDNLLKRIIFISKGYIRQASQNQIYIDFLKEGKLYSDWEAKHKSFYQKDYYNKLLKMREYNQFKMVERYMISLSLNQSPSQTRIHENNYGEDSEEEILSFGQALDLITFKWR